MLILKLKKLKLFQVKETIHSKEWNLKLEFFKALLERLEQTSGKEEYQHNYNQFSGIFSDNLTLILQREFRESQSEFLTI